MINQELMDEIIYVSLKKQFISKELIERIVLNIIFNCDEKTKNLFGGLNFKELKWDCMIAEVDENCNINANYDKMIEVANNDANTYLEKNLEVMCYLLHEIEHLKEDYKKESNTFESEVVKYGCGEYIYDKLSVSMLEKVKNEDKADKITEYRYEKFNEKKWGLIPCERIAEATARKNILKSLSNYPKYEDLFFNEYKNLTKFYLNSLKMEYLNREYSFSSSPIYRFYDFINVLGDLKYILSITPKLSAEEKMMYGMPITPKDVIEINKMKIKTRR